MQRRSIDKIDDPEPKLGNIPLDDPVLGCDRVVGGTVPLSVPTLPHGDIDGTTPPLSSTGGGCAIAAHHFTVPQLGATAVPVGMPAEYQVDPVLKEEILHVSQHIRRLRLVPVVGKCVVQGTVGHNHEPRCNAAIESIASVPDLSALEHPSEIIVLRRIVRRIRVTVEHDHVRNSVHEVVVRVAKLVVNVVEVSSTHGGPNGWADPWIPKAVFVGHEGRLGAFHRRFDLVVSGGCDEGYAGEEGFDECEPGVPAFGVGVGVGHVAYAEGEGDGFGIVVGGGVGVGDDIVVGGGGGLVQDN